MASLKIGLMTLIICMLGIFAVLMILSAATIIVDKILDSMNKSKQRKSEAAPVSAESAAPAPVVEQGISPTTVAAIMAALSTATGGKALRYTAICRANNSGWAQSGTAELISTRQQYL